MEGSDGIDPVRPREERTTLSSFPPSTVTVRDRPARWHGTVLDTNVAG
jgi:hypothetical protein